MSINDRLGAPVIYALEMLFFSQYIKSWRTFIFYMKYSTESEKNEHTKL